MAIKNKLSGPEVTHISSTHTSLVRNNHMGRYKLSDKKQVFVTLNLTKNSKLINYVKCVYYPIHLSLHSAMHWISFSSNIYGDFESIL